MSEVTGCASIGFDGARSAHVGGRLDHPSHPRRHRDDHPEAPPRRSCAEATHRTKITLVDGVATFAEQIVVPAEWHDLARVGVRFEVPGDLDQLTWFGPGPLRRIPIARRAASCRVGLRPSTSSSTPMSCPRNMGLIPMPGGCRSPTSGQRHRRCRPAADGSHRPGRPRRHPRRRRRSPSSIPNRRSRFTSIPPCADSVPQRAGPMSSTVSSSARVDIASPGRSEPPDEQARQMV